jgi:hypothetical protein
MSFGTLSSRLRGIFFFPRAIHNSFTEPHWPRSFALGLSIWTPWKDIFQRLPVGLLSWDVDARVIVHPDTHVQKRIYAKVLATADMELKYKPKVLVSQVWNAIIISMYREHLLSIDRELFFCSNWAPPKMC